MLEGAKAPFKAAAYGRLGGQNVSVTLTPIGVGELKAKGLDPEEFALHVQHLIVQGEFKVDASARPPARRAFRSLRCKLPMSCAPAIPGQAGLTLILPPQPMPRASRIPLK